MRSKFLRLLQKFEKREHRKALVEMFSTGTVALYTFTSNDDRKYVRDFTSLIELEQFLSGQEVQEHTVNAS